MKSFFKKIWLWTFRLVLFCVLLLLLCDFYAEIIGIPRGVVRKALEGRLPENLELQLGHCRVGLLRGVNIYEIKAATETPVGRVQCDIEHLKIDLRLEHLLQGVISLERIDLKNSEIRCFNALGNEMFHLNCHSLNSYLGDQGIGRVDIQAQLNDILLKTTMKVTHVEKLSEMFRNTSPGAPSKDEALSLKLSSFFAFLNECDLGCQNAVIDLQALLDCSDWSQIQVNGAFHLKNAILSKVIVEELRGKINYQNQMLRVDNLIWHFGQNEYLSANGNLDLKKKRMNGNLKGKLIPLTVFKMLNAEAKMPEELADISSPVELDWTVQDSPLNWHQLQGKLNCKMENLSFHKLRIPVCQVEAQMASNGEMDYHIYMKLKEKSSEFLSWNIKLNSAEWKAYSRLELQVRLKRLFDELGWTIPKGVDPEEELTSLLLELPETTLRDITSDFLVKATLKHPNFKCFGKNYKDFQLEWNWNGRHLQITEGSFKLENNSFKVGSIKGNSNVSLLSLYAFNYLLYCMDKIPAEPALPEQVSVNMDLNVNAFDEKQQPVEGLSLKGTLSLQPKQLLFSVNMNGKLFSDRIFKTYCSDLEFSGREYVENIYCEDTPILFTLELPGYKLGDNSFLIKGNMELENGGFDTFKNKRLLGSYEINEKHSLLQFKDVLTQDGITGKLDVDIVYTPYSVSLRDLVVHGDPLVALPYIFNKNSREIYQQIFEDFVWDKASPPTIEIPLMLYKSDEWDVVWELNLQGHIHALNALYGGLATRELDLDLNLELPGKVTIAPIKATLENGIIEGRTDFSFGGRYHCTFEVTRAEGAFVPYYIFREINPTAFEDWKTIRLSEGSKIYLQGNFYLQGNPELVLSGNIYTPECTFKNLQIQNTSLSWNYADDIIRWDVKDGHIFGGQMTTSGVYDLAADYGNFLLITHQTQLDSLIRFLNTNYRPENNQSVIPGVIDSEFRLNLMRNWADRPYHLEGDAKAHVYNADLWKVPLLKQLGHVMELSSFGSIKGGDFGKISEMKLNFLFKGESMDITHLKTNGTIIALEGEGHFDWQKDYMKFDVKTKLLKEINILSYLFSPLTWLLQAELTGSTKEHEWKLKSGFGRLFNGEGKEE